MKPKLYEKYLVIFRKALYDFIEGEYSYLTGPTRSVVRGKKKVRVGFDPEVEPVTTGPYFALNKQEAIKKALEEHPEFNKGYYGVAKSYKDILKERKKQSNESK